MSADEHVNQAQFHWYTAHKPTKRMYPRHMPRSEVRKATHPTRGIKGNRWQAKGEHGK